MIQIAHVRDCDGQGQTEAPLRRQRVLLPEAALRGTSGSNTKLYNFNIGSDKSQVWQCLGFCKSDFRCLLVYKSAAQKPKHSQSLDFSLPLLITTQPRTYQKFHVILCPQLY